MNDDIKASGFVSNYSIDNTFYYTTREQDEVILFKTEDGKYVNCNDCCIINGNQDLVIAFVNIHVGYKPDETVTISRVMSKKYMRANSQYVIQNVDIDGIKVFAPIGSKIAYECKYY